MAECWPDAEEREVAGTASEVRDQDKFIVIQSSLVIVGGADRFVFEGCFLKAGALHGGFEASQGKFFVLGGLRSRKSHGTADYSGRT